MKILQTFDNKCYEITDEQNENLMAQSILGKTGGVWISSEYVSFSSIKSITELRSEQPVYPQLAGSVFSRSDKNGRKLMLKGFKKWLDKNPESIKAQVFYEDLLSLSI